jgi:hypothetical protein
VLYRWRHQDREDGLRLGQLLWFAFRACGLSVWMDHYNLRTGDNLKESVGLAITSIKNVVIPLLPGSFDRCSDHDDFFRWEIQTALDCNCNVMFVCFDMEDYQELFQREDEDDAFFGQLKQAMTNHLVTFVAMEKNFEKTIEDISNRLKQLP